MLFGMQESVLLTKFDRNSDTDNGDTQSLMLWILLEEFCDWMKKLLLIFISIYIIDIDIHQVCRNRNIVKYYYSLLHYSSLQCHMILQKSF